MRKKNPVSSRSRYVHERVRPPSQFVKGSFRTVVKDGGVILGRLKGERRRTRTGRPRLTVQAVLHPKRRRHTLKRKNPTTVILGNPPRERVPWWRSVIGRVTRIEYIHAADGHAYYHDFRPPAWAVAQADGSVRLWHPSHKLWKEFR